MHRDLGRRRLAPPAALLERESELALLEPVLDGHGDYAYVEGHAGIGKTRLLETAAALARDRGVDVLEARGDELEAAFSYGVVRQLLEQTVLPPPAGAAAMLLAGPAAHAAAALGLPRTPGPAGAPDSAFPVVHGLYRLTIGLAERRPLLLVVDDAHWADLPSLRFLDYLAGRLTGANVSMILAARPAEPGARVDALQRLRDRHRPHLLRPRPLSAGATGVLLGDRFGRPAAAAFVSACHHATAGNPFLLHELADALQADGVAPTSGAAGIVRGLGPDTVARSLLLRLGRLPAEAGKVVDAVATFGHAAEVRHVAVLTELSPETVADVADLLADVHVLAPERPLRFVHPIVREAVYAEIRPAARARLHARAAAALTAEGHPPAQAAAHLLLTDPVGDGDRVEVLRAAGSVAIAQGAADLAQTYLQRALGEPPTRAVRADVLAELGHAELLTGRDVAAAGAHLEAAMEATADPALRAARADLAAQARLFEGDLAGAIRLLDGARTQVDDADVALGITAHQAALALLSPPSAPRAIQRLEAHREVSGETAAELAGARWLDGRIGEAAGFAERAIARDRLLEAEGPASVAFNHATRILVDADRHDVALPALERGIDLARAQGAVLATASLTGTRGIAHARSGDVAAAAADARAVLELLELGGVPVVSSAHWAYLALAQLERGDLDAAERAIERSGCGPGLPALTYMEIVWLARARVRLARGRPAEALADLRELQARDRRLGVRHLSVPWHLAAVEACLALDDARGAVAFADEQLERAERWSTPSGRGVALATKGLAIGGEPGVALLADGADLLAGSPARLDHARALLHLGVVLRQAGRRAEARERLRAALAGAERCGAAELATRAGAELAVAGAKPRRRSFSGVEALTASERRVAQLAAAGSSNRQIAAALFITVRTVENHLARAYRKLGISSRRDLPSALG